MIEVDFVKEVSRELRANQELVSLVACPTEARLIPFQQSESDNYIAVAVALAVNAICLRTLSKIANTVVKTVLNVSTSRIPPAIEILFFAMEAELTDRVLSVSVYKTAFSHQFLMTPSILLNQTTITGVTCVWYWESASVPMQPRLS